MCTLRQNSCAPDAAPADDSAPGASHCTLHRPAVPTDLTLGIIRDAITKRHGGGVPEVTLYKDSVRPGATVVWARWTPMSRYGTPLLAHPSCHTPRANLHPQAKPANSLAAYSDDTKLQDVPGMTAGVIYGTTPELPQLTLHYDFQAPASDCPIAFVEPEPIESKYKVPLKEYLRAVKQHRPGVA